MRLTNVLGRAMRIPLLLLLAGSLAGQRDQEPYFALSSYQTYRPGEKPIVSLSSRNVDTVEFRVYRINDATKFFQKLEQPHEFGGKAEQPAKEKTPLEKVHQWKRTLRANIRRALRGQFTESPSAHASAFLPGKVAPPPMPAVVVPATQYAESPVLNPQQLVLTFTQPVNAAERWNQQEVPVPVQEKGMYLVEAVNHELRAYTVIFVSDVLLVSKAGKGHILNFVADKASGQPLPGIEVNAVSKGSVLATGRTDKDGTVDLTFKTEPHTELTVVATKNGDVAANTLSAPNGDEWMGYIFTDRPIYRPGHLVNFKGILRSRTADGHEVPAGQKVTVEIQDPDQKPVYQKSLVVSASGTIHDELQLAPGAALGSYFISVKKEHAAGEYEDTATATFDVEAYRKPEYEVRVTPLRARVRQGDTARATIEARYFFGEPVSGAKVTYTVYRSHFWFPLWYDPEDVQDEGNGDDGYFSGDQILEQRGQLDAEGKLQIEIPMEVATRSADLMYRIEARVTDEGNREISGAGRIVGTYGDFALNVTPDRYVYSAGNQASVKVEARNYENQPVRTKVHLELVRWNYLDKSEDSVLSLDAETGANGEARALVQLPAQGGSFRVRATAGSGGTNGVEARIVSDIGYLWITGKGDVWGSDRRSVDIIPDHKTYKPGETAKMLIVSGQPGATVFITMEGRDVRQHKVIHSQDSTVAFEFPVEARFEPGVTVTATYVRKGEVYTGTKYVRVPPVDHRLNIRLATDKPQYLPGESAHYSLDVTDDAGRPVPRAELSLGVVDEAIYGIRPDATPNILTFFFGRSYYGVNTALSTNFYFSGSAGKRRMLLTELRDRSHLAQLKPERLVQPKIRKAFPDTAFWAPEVTTDNNGHARAKVDFPDSLTTWRATARAVAPGTMVGSATLKTIVRKNLILRLVTPRFLVTGDEVTVYALVHNYLATEKKARVSLDVKGLTVLSGKTQDVTIPSKGEAKVEWRLKPGAAGTAVLTGKALTDEESDGLELELPVQFPGLRLSSAKGGSIPAGTSTEFDVMFPQNVVAGSRTLSFNAAPTIAGSLFSALEYLTAFPYGCVEQTMSSFLPNIVVKDAVQSLGLKADLKAASLAEKIQAGLDRLYAFQHQDGGWGWWETDASHPFMTAYVVAGFAQARASGTAVREDAINRGVEWLKKDLALDTKRGEDLRAYMVYALTVAGQNDPARLSALFENRSALSPYGLAMLGLALENAKDARAAEIAATLEAGAQQDGQQAWWPAKRDPMLDFDTNATPEATAFILRFLSHQKPGSPLLPKAALWLVDHRNEGYWWSTTKQTAMVIYSMIDYLKATKELSPNLKVTVEVNGKAVLTRQFDQSTAVNSSELVLPESSLLPGSNHVRISSSGAGRVYYGARSEYNSLEAPPVNPAMKLTREYFRLVPGKAGDRIVYDTVPLEGPVAPGDTLAVKLSVAGATSKYMILEDPIPAGTEFIEKDRLYELRSAPPWWKWYYDRREQHDDHMAIFQTYFPGNREYFYLLKVVNPGVFQVKPAKAGPMYQTEISAVTDSRLLEVK